MDRINVTQASSLTGRAGFPACSSKEAFPRSDGLPARRSLGEGGGSRRFKFDGWKPSFLELSRIHLIGSSRTALRSLHGQH